MADAVIRGFPAGPWTVAVFMMLSGGPSLEAREWRHYQPSLRSQVAPLSEASAQRLLSELCTGAVLSVPKIGLECPVRSLGAAFTDIGSRFHSQGVIFGHFLGPASEDAVVSGWSEETHPARWGGTLLLSRRNGVWKPLWYKSAVITRSCEKFSRLDQRELLLCEDEDGGMGHTFHELYVVDLLDARDFQHNPALARAHSFNDGCIEQRQQMDTVAWSADRKSLSVVIRTPHWERLPHCPDPSARGKRPPVIQRLRFGLTERGLRLEHPK